MLRARRFTFCRDKQGPGSQPRLGLRPAVPTTTAGATTLSMSVIGCQTDLDSHLPTVFANRIHSTYELDAARKRTLLYFTLLYPQVHTASR
jgi:hypothetical protein